MKTRYLTHQSKSAPRIAQSVTYDVVRIHDLTAEAYTHLRNLNMRKLGQMQNDITMLRKWCKTDAKLRDAAYAVVANHPKHGIVGWSLLFNDVLLTIVKSPTATRQHTIDFYKNTKVQWVGEFYVKRRFRGMGIGTELFTRMRAIRKTFYKYRHTEQARGFFRKNGRLER